MIIRTFNAKNLSENPVVRGVEFDVLRRSIDLRTHTGTVELRALFGSTHQADV